MADQLNMNGLNLGPDGQQGGGPHGGRSYIPPHMRNRGPPPPPAAMNGPGPNGPPPGPPGPGGPPMNGIGNSNWAGKLTQSKTVAML